MDEPNSQHPEHPQSQLAAEQGLGTDGQSEKPASILVVQCPTCRSERLIPCAAALSAEQEQAEAEMAWNILSDPQATIQIVRFP